MGYRPENDVCKVMSGPPARFHVFIVAIRRTHVEGGNTRRLREKDWGTPTFMAGQGLGHPADAEETTYPTNFPDPINWI